MSLKVAVLLSGSGTTLQNLIDRIDAGELGATIVCVISSQPDAYGLERAKIHGIPHAVIARKDFPDAGDFSKAIWSEVKKHGAALTALAGFMCKLEIPKALANRVMNVHPALVPAFCGQGMYGHRVHEAVIAAGVKVSGATVHFVDNEYDHGPIILQAAVPVLDDDTPDSLATRVQAKERELYPRAIELFAEDRLHVEKRRVRIG